MRVGLEDEHAVREAEISAYGMLDRQHHRELAGVVQLAATICGVPMATVNLITAHEQHQIAAYGFDGAICRREDSMCALILKEDAPVHVPDTLQDPRFMDHPFVTGELGAVRFYAAHKLVSPDGVAFGTLCVFDTEPRELSYVQLGALGTLADRIMDVFALHMRARQVEKSLREVEEMRARLERSNERLLAFAGQITHDLKTPLTTMALSIELLRDELEVGATQDEVLPLVSRALGGSARMTQMIEDVLAFARLGTSVDLGPVDLGRLVQDVADDLALSGGGLTIHAADDLPTVLGDESLLRALIQNLISNARKFHAPDVAPQVAITARPVDGHWRIEVSDNGIGVPDDQKTRIFEPMVRLDKTFDGVGIGLATCLRVVDAHEGRIGVEDNPAGQGSTFWVELPL